MLTSPRDACETHVDHQAEDRSKENPAILHIVVGLWPPPLSPADTRGSTIDPASRGHNAAQSRGREALRCDMLRGSMVKSMGKTSLLYSVGVDIVR
jgi:hypothetical protein